MIVLATARSETPVADDLIERWATRADRAHAGLRRSPAARYDSVLARAAMRALLFSQTGQNDWQFCQDARGKLSIANAEGVTGPAICVAHSRGTVACGLGHVRALGIDIEAHRSRPFSAIADWSFGPSESAAVAAGGAAAFYRIWTLREAIGKATGAGLSLVTDRQDRVQGGPAEGAWRQPIGGAPWLLGHFHTIPAFSIAVAAVPHGSPADEAIAVRWVDLDVLASRPST